MIAPDNIFGLLAVFLCLSAAAALMETTSLGRRISGVGIVLIGALVAAQFEIIPRSAPFYSVIWTYLVPLAISLFLLKADLIKVFMEGGRVVVAFVIGAVGAAAGAVIGAFFFDLGPHEPAIAAIFSATYIGGSLNFVAVAEAVRLDDPSELAAALAIDNILGVSFIIFMNFVAGWKLLQRRFSWRVKDIWGEESAEEETENQGFSFAGLLTALALATAIVAASTSLAAYLGYEQYALLFITVIMTAVATIGRRMISRLRGEEMVAMIFMYLFFAIIGAGADVNGILNAAPGLFLEVLLIFSVHLVFIVIAGVLLKLNYAELVVASLACIAGPPIAAAIAILMKWRNLVVPGILTGILGYVIGNFVGIGIFKLLGGALS